MQCFHIRAAPVCMIILSVPIFASLMCICSMLYLAGDICTHNKYECKVISSDLCSKLVEISYAVFLNNGEKIFEDEIKTVPANRLKLISRIGGHADVVSDTDSLPSFSVRQERWMSTNSSCVDLTATCDETPPGSDPDVCLKRLRDKPSRARRETRCQPEVESSASYSSAISSSASSVRSSSSDESLKQQENRVKKRLANNSKRNTRESNIAENSHIKQRRQAQNISTRVGHKSPAFDYITNPIVPDCDVDSSVSSSSYSSVTHVKQRRQTKRVTTRVHHKSPAFDDITNPIVPDWDVDSSASSSSCSSSDEFSQEHLAMERRARELERKASHDEHISYSDEVVFEWDSRRKKVVQFIDSQESSPQIVEKTIHTIQNVELYFQSQTDKSEIETLTATILYTDSIHESVNVEKLFECIKNCLNSRKFCPNIATEMRIFLVSSTFKSQTGWLTAVYISLYLAYVYKRQLFCDFATRIYDKMTCNELKLIFLLSSNEWFDELAGLLQNVHTVLSEYTQSPPDTRRLIEQFVLIKTKQNLPCEMIQAPICQILAAVFPPPGELVSSPKMVSHVSQIVEYVLHFWPIKARKFGGFLPCTSDNHRFTFGNYKGVTFRQVLSGEKKYCDWAERLVDPFSLEIVHWIDYVCLDRYWCVCGLRAVRTDIDIIRISKNSSLIPIWIESKVAQLKICVAFYQRLNWDEYLVYASCVLCMFQCLSSTGSEQTSVSTQKSCRAEIVKEVIRPLIRLGEFAPEWKTKIANAILLGRATIYKYTIEDAKRDFKTIHGIDFDEKNFTRI